MIKDNLAYIANHFWMESIQNLSKHLTITELKSFNSNDYYYLTTIHYMNGPNFSQVAEVLKLTKPAITALVVKLSKLGLLEKVQSEEDKRIFYVVLTEKGRKIIEGDEALYGHFDALIRKLAGTEKVYDAVDNLLEALKEQLENEYRDKGDQKMEVNQ